MQRYEVPSRRSERIQLEDIAVVPVNLGQTALWVVTMEGVAERGYTVLEENAAAIVINAANAGLDAPAYDPLYNNVAYLCGHSNSEHSVLSFDETVSRPNAVISIDNDTLLLRDCQSVNGTYFEDPIRLHEVSDDTEGGIHARSACLPYRMELRDGYQPSFSWGNNDSLVTGLFDGLGASKHDDIATLHATRMAKEKAIEQLSDTLLPSEAIQLVTDGMKAANRSVVTRARRLLADINLTGAVMSVQRHAEQGYHFAALAWTGDIKTYIVRGGKIIQVKANRNEPSQDTPTTVKTPDHPFHKAKAKIEARRAPPVIINGSGGFVPHTAWFTVIPGDQILSLSKDINAVLNESELLKLCQAESKDDVTDRILSFADDRRQELELESYRTGMIITQTVI